MADGPPSELKGGRYAILGVIAEGSQAQTLDAIDKLLGRPVALKRFFVRGAKEWKDVELAEREARVLRDLSHPLLPRYVDYFEEDGALCLVMEKVEGESLADLRARGGSLGPNEVWRFLEDSAAVLAYLHGRAPPVIHRDIKPGNVIRRPDGSFVLVDFGSVRDKLKPAGGSTVVGTFGYMAPEQFQGRASPASDVYGVGVTALVLLTGQEPEELPHRGLAIDVARALKGHQVPELASVLERMLQPDPDQRAGDLSTLLASASRRTRGGQHAARGTRQNAREQRRHERAERHQRRTLERAQRVRRPLPPFVALLFTIGLLVARMSVLVVLRIIVPLVLSWLALFFGPALRRAAASVSQAGVRAGTALQEALRAVQPPARWDAIETEGVEVGRHGARRVRVDAPPPAPETPGTEADELAAEDEPAQPDGVRRRRD